MKKKLVKLKLYGVANGYLPRISSSLLISSLAIASIVYFSHKEEITEMPSVSLSAVSQSVAAEGQEIADTLASGWQKVTIQPGDILSNLFTQKQLSLQDLMVLLQQINPEESNYLKHLSIGHSLLWTNQGRELMGLAYQTSEKNWLWIERKDNHFVSQIVGKPPVIQTAKAETSKPLAPQPSPVSVKEGLNDKSLHYISGEVKGSFYSSAIASGLSVRQVIAFEKIFKDQLNFTRDIRSGDRFRIIIKPDSQRGSVIELAEVQTGDKVFQAVEFPDEKGRSHYYTPTGQSLEKGLLRAPLSYRYVSSSFSSGRLHPLLNIVRPHYGVDYAANYGTPIKAAGDGVIKTIGMENGYGRVIEITHNKIYSTRYAHLSRFNPTIKAGMHVTQGQIIGYVGESGLATGSHLHYEIRVNGKPQNPLTVSLPSSTPVPAGERQQFLAKANQLVRMLNSPSKA